MQTEIEVRFPNTGFVYVKGQQSVPDTRVGFSPGSTIRNRSDLDPEKVYVWYARGWPEATPSQLQAAIKTLDAAGFPVG